jgi:hypothetical protein
MVRHLNLRVVLSWIFPSSKKDQLNVALFLTLLSLALAFFGIGVEMTQDYRIVKVFFWLTWLTAVLTIWMSLVVLKALARNVWTFIGALGIGISLVYGYTFFCPVLTVSPNEIEFGEADLGREIHTFAVENKSGRDLYYVQLTLKGVHRGQSPDQFEFDIPLGYRIPITSGSDYADTLALACNTDNRNEGLMIFQIFHLRPNERREFTLTHLTNMLETIHASITYFSYDQAPAIGDPHEMEQDLIALDQTIRCYYEILWPADGKPLIDNRQIIVTPKGKVTIK